MQNDFMQAVEFSHQLLKRHVKKGSRLVDATAGRGWDTLFMAELAGENGHVWAFDIQKEAVESTKKLLQENNLEQRVKVIQDNHSHLADYVQGKLDAMIFNLGYLPGGNKEIITRPGDTITALENCLPLLTNGGIVVVVCYSSHQGGAEETKAVMEFFKGLDHRKFNVLQYHFLNQIKTPPQVMAVKKR